MGVFIGVFSCEKPTHSDIECQPIEIQTPCSNCPEYVNNGAAYGSPYFNPNNPNEFLYAGSKESDRGIIKYNILDKTHQVIYKLTDEYTIASRAKWNNNDWILLVLKKDLNFNIWKIKSNGDSLTQLTFTNKCFDPEWNLSGDKFVYELGYTSPTISIIADENGQTLDTIQGGTPYSWQHDSLGLTSGIPGISYFTLGNGIPTRLYYVLSEDNILYAMNAIWINNEEIIWPNSTGIYKININTEQIEKIKETCENRVYIHSAYSPISNKLIFTRLDREQVGPQTIQNTTRIVMMNTDGTGEEVIDLDYQ